jgi:large subunit ribosomal protein L10
MVKTDRTRKSAFVGELADKLADASFVYVTDFTGLDVERLTRLRRALRSASVEYVVVKNTLARRALEGTSAAALAELLEGPSAFALSRADAVAAAKVLADFARDGDVPRLKGGVVAGRRLEVADIRRLATLPGREVLLGLALGTMRAPVAGLAVVLGGLLAKFVRTLDAVRAARAEAGGAGTEVGVPAPSGAGAAGGTDGGAAGGTGSAGGAETAGAPPAAAQAGPGAGGAASAAGEATSGAPAPAAAAGAGEDSGGAEAPA